MNVQTNNTVVIHDSGPFDDLMTAGHEAYKAGEKHLAHDLWRQAAVIDPYEERVWLLLLRVLDKDADRIACLENIVAINPANASARRRLRAYEARSSHKQRRQTLQMQQVKRHRRFQFLLLRRSIVDGLLIGLFAIVLALIVSVYIFGH